MEKRKLHPIDIIDRGIRVTLSEVRRSFEADSIIDVCERLIGAYGKPASIRTDNHHCFRSRRFNGWLDKKGIRHL